MARINAFDRKIEKDLDGEFGKRIIRECPAVERRSNLSVEEFEVEYFNSGRPVILKNAGRDWAIWKKWNFDFLRQTYGEDKVAADVYSKQPRVMKMSEVLDGILNYDPTSKTLPAYLQQWSLASYAPELLGDFKPLEYIRKNWFAEKMNLRTGLLWVGPQNATTFIHQDIYGLQTWNAQIVGRKLWFMFSPESQPLNTDKEVDYDKFLADPKSKATYFYLEPGEIAFVPKGWWHRVRTLEPSINLSGHILGEEDVPRMVKAIMITEAMGWLNHDLIKNSDPGLYETSRERCRARMLAFGLDPNDILGINKEISVSQATDLINLKGKFLES
ncbi:MAG: cupin-like domain-containing protein [Pseudobdellovibrionaceae bacterium]